MTESELYGRIETFNEIAPEHFFERAIAGLWALNQAMHPDQEPCRSWEYPKKEDVPQVVPEKPTGLPHYQPKFLESSES